MYPSSADILIVCPGLAPYLRKTDNSIWSVRNTPIIGLTAVSGLAGRWMSGVTRLIMSSCFFLRKPTVSLLYYLLCRTYKELLYRKKKNPIQTQVLYFTFTVLSMECSGKHVHFKALTSD